jgi:small subunit ribosomal protein S8
MSMQDPIADMVVRIKNATIMEKIQVSMPSSKMKEAIAEVLKNEGYITNYHREQNGAKATLVISLKYYEGKSVIEELKRISKPSYRRYSGALDIPKVVNGYGITIVSTPKGVMSDAQARASQVGGELLITVL